MLSSETLIGKSTPELLNDISPSLASTLTLSPTSPSLGIVRREVKSRVTDISSIFPLI